MPYSAIVLDNTDFFTKGTITVRVAKYYNAEFIWDLSDNSAILNEFEQLKKNNKVEDFNNCLVSSPLGGGRNFGMFMLPQVNSVGRISFMDNTLSQPLWEGAYFRPHRGDDFIVDYVGIPNDQPDKEGKDVDGARKESNIEGDEGTIILRQKSTTADDYDWQSVNTQNLIVLDGNRLKIIHFLEWDGDTPKKWQEIVAENGELSIQVKNDADSNFSSVLLKDKEMKMTVDDGNESSVTLSTDNPGLKLELDGTNVAELLGNADFLVKYQDLVDIIGKIGTHSHVCPVNGMTTGVLDAGKPFDAAIIKLKDSMKAKRLKTE